MFLWIKPIPPFRAIDIAILDSVTVSIDAETSGMLSFIFLVRRVVILVSDGNISEYEIDPKAFDVYQNNLEDLQINSPSDSLKLVQATFRNEDFLSGKNITALNSAAVIYVSGQTDNFLQAFEIAMNVLESGKAQKKLDELISFSRKFDEST